MFKSTTSCLKNHLLTKEQKKHLMLKDLHEELKKYKHDPEMQWWVLTLERKIKEMYEHH